MADEVEDDDKTEEASPRKLEEARKKGDVVYSPEATSWLMLAAGALVITLAGASAADGVGRSLIGLLSQPHAFGADGMSLIALMGEIGIKIAGALGFVFLALALAGIAGRFVQDQPVWSSEKLKPDLSRINPFEGAKRVFGKQAMMNFVKGLLKFVVVGAAVTWALWPRDGSLEQAVYLDLGALWALMQEKALAVLFACLAAFSALALADYVLTRQDYMKRQRMTRTELKDEFRQTEGDPMVRARLRQIRLERSKRRMMQAVPGATVVVANPTHYAVALKYEAGETPAPICVAKGVDEVALKIREVAEANNVPVIEDPPLARALFGAADLDQPIPRAHYEAVARIIGLVAGLAQRRRTRRI
jgi:flagellar biosynthetic protein FlhB